MNHFSAPVNNGFQCTGQQLQVYSTTASSVQDNGFECTGEWLQVYWTTASSVQHNGFEWNDRNGHITN